MKVEPINETQNQDYIELDLDALIKLGVIEREVEIGGIKFTMRTLTEKEKQEVEAETNDGLPIDDPRHIMNSKIPTLARSIVKVNNKPVTPKQLKGILEKMQSHVLDSLFLKYTELVKDQMDLLMLGAKKNGL